MSSQAFYAKQPPARIPPLAPEEMTEDLLLLMRAMMKVNDAIDSREKDMFDDLVAPGADHADPAFLAQLAALPEYLRTVMRHPDLFARLFDVGIQLLARGLLPARERELAILRLAWLCRAPYEWGEHVMVAKKCGVTSAEIERVTHGSAAPGWTRHESALLRAVEELHASADITDATWAALAQTYDARQMMELPILIGQYQLVAYYQNAYRMRLHQGNLGLDAR